MSKTTNSIAWKTSLEGKTLVVYDVFDPAKLNFSNVDIVELRWTKIDTLTVDMQSQITNVRELELWFGSVPTVHVATQLKKFVINSCKTIEVIIKTNITYSIEHLDITWNKLEKVPKHLNTLQNLKELLLNGNQIEYVNMADFNGMNKLEKIDLHYNKILEINAKPAPVLPSLLSFIADNNLLSSINFEHWSATSLRQISLGHNRLSIALAIQNVFPSLEFVALDGNPFYCEWLNATLKELETRRVYIDNEAITTCSKEPELLDKFRKIQFQNTFATKQEMQNTNNKLDTSAQNIKTLQDSFKQSQKSQQQKISELEKSNQDYKTKIDSLEQFQKVVLAEIEQLKHKDADLTEALYLHEIEALHDPITRQDANEAGTSSHET